MRISIQILTLAAAALLAASSCTQDEVITPPPERGGTPVEFTMGVRALSRTVTEGDVTDFVAGDEVGIFATGEEDGNTWTNERYGYNGNTWSGNITVYEGSSYNYYAYYPYNAQVTGTTSLFTVDTDQSGGYNHSDVLIATGTSDNANVTLNYDHAFTLVEVVLQAGSENIDLTGATVALTNVLPSASINLQAKEVGAASGTAGSVTMCPTEEHTYRAIVPAQSIAQGQSALMVAAGDGTYHRFNPTTSISYAQGQMLRMIITVGNEESGEDPDPEDPDDPDPDDPDNPDPDDPDNPDPDDPDNPDPDDPDNPDEPDPDPDPEPEPEPEGDPITVIIGSTVETGIEDWMQVVEGFSGTGTKYTSEIEIPITADIAPFSGGKYATNNTLKMTESGWFTRYAANHGATVSFAAGAVSVTMPTGSTRGWNNCSFGYHAKGEYPLLKNARYRLTFNVSGTATAGGVLVRTSQDNFNLAVVQDDGLSTVQSFNVRNGSVSCIVNTSQKHKDASSGVIVPGVDDKVDFAAVTDADLSSVYIYFFNNTNTTDSGSTLTISNIRFELVK